MTKWADFLISAVRYSPDRKHIEEMKQHEDNEGIPENESVVNRQTVADGVKKGKTYMTVFSSGTNWRIGSRVRRFIVNGNYYLRVDKNKVDRDNLGTLPEF